MKYKTNGKTYKLVLSKSIIKSCDQCDFSMKDRNCPEWEKSRFLMCVRYRNGYFRDGDFAKNAYHWEECSEWATLKQIRRFFSVLFNFSPSKNVSKDNILVKSRLPESMYRRSTDDNR